jgi:hypothetical protein
MLSLQRKIYNFKDLDITIFNICKKFFFPEKSVDLHQKIQLSLL